jgi:hypothetical protein
MKTGSGAFSAPGGDGRGRRVSSGSSPAHARVILPPGPSVREGDGQQCWPPPREGRPQMSSRSKPRAPRGAPRARPRPRLACESRFVSGEDSSIAREPDYIMICAARDAVHVVGLGVRRAKLSPPAIPRGALVPLDVIREVRQPDNSVTGRMARRSTIGQPIILAPSPFPPSRAPRNP